MFYNVYTINGLGAFCMKNKRNLEIPHISVHVYLFHMVRNRYNPSHTHTHTHTHSENCLPAGFTSLMGRNTSFNQTGQLRTNFSFVVTAWGAWGLQSLYWQSTAVWLFVQKVWNNLVWILIILLTHWYLNRLLLSRGEIFSITKYLSVITLYLLTVIAQNRLALKCILLNHHYTLNACSSDHKQLYGTLPSSVWFLSSLNLTLSLSNPLSKFSITSSSPTIKFLSYHGDKGQTHNTLVSWIWAHGMNWQQILAHANLNHPSTEGSLCRKLKVFGKKLAKWLGHTVMVIVCWERGDGSLNDWRGRG